MGSSKKKGQQRKAAKKALSAAAKGSSSDGVSGGDVGVSSGANSKIVAKVRRGNNYATKRLDSGAGEGEVISYEESGVLSVVLEFLKRCEDETFEGVINSVGGDLKSPSVWINILVSASFIEPSCKLQIVKNIGPLVRCMINDTNRLLFKSSKHWRQGITPFVNLITNILERKANKTLEDEKIVDTMLQYNGLLRSITKWGFWFEFRPDIVKELRTGGMICTGIILLSRRVIELLLNDDDMEEERRIQLLETIGTSPIVNKEYDPSCMTSYTAELVRRLKNHAYAGDFTSVFGSVRRLMGDGDCVDKEVITEVIDLGLNHVGNYEDSLKVGMLLLEVINQGSAINKYTSDTRTAFAIRAGLIDMCLGFMNRFGKHESFEDDGMPMHGIIRWIFNGINNVSLHKKTAKAIRRNISETMLLQLEEVTNNSEGKKLFDMLKSILYLNRAYCYRCNKSLSRTEVKQCNGCHRMTYCSRVCQEQDWSNGHSVTCCKAINNENIGTFQGRDYPEEVPDDRRAAAKLKEIEINMNMIHLKLILDNSENIMTQAKGFGIPLGDCVVHFDLRECPPGVMVFKYTNSICSADDIEVFEKSRSKDNIMCVYHSNIYIRGVEEELAMQRFFPHEWLMK